jgi:serum/glucocorticoid-regulated kinase 2
LSSWRVDWVVDTALQTRDKLYLVTDYIPGGELFFWLKRDRVFSQSRVRLYAAELVLALEHLHDHDVVYRDLKPENILLDGEGHIKLTDFGLSKEAVTGFGSEGGTLTFCGTPEYLAPEILENTGHGKAVDWWSLGTLLYEMCAGLPPFYDENIEDMYEKIMTAELSFPRHFLPETRSLLSGLLQRDYRRRLGYHGADEIKKHPFFASISWDDVAHRRVTPVFCPPPPTTDSDVPNFEDEFTRETPMDSVPDSRAQLSSTQAERAHFEGFTYTGTTLAAAAPEASHE